MVPIYVSTRNDRRLINRDTQSQTHRDNDTQPYLHVTENSGHCSHQLSSSVV